MADDSVVQPSLFGLEPLAPISPNGFFTPDRCQDEWDINGGMPEWVEKFALIGYFPTLCRDKGRILKGGRQLKAIRANKEHVYWPDIALVFGNDLDADVAAFVEVERKTDNTANYLFKPECDLPIHVPVYSFRSHKGEVTPMVYSGKFLLFQEHPEQSFFMAIHANGSEAFITTGSAVIAAPQRWVMAAGPFRRKDDPRTGQIYVAQVPRFSCLHCQVGHKNAEGFILETIKEML